MDTHITSEQIINWSTQIENLAEEHKIKIPTNSRYYHYKKVITDLFSNASIQIDDYCNYHNIKPQYLPNLFKEYYDYLYCMENIINIYSLSNPLEQEKLKKKIETTFKGQYYLENDSG